MRGGERGNRLGVGEELSMIERHEPTGLLLVPGRECTLIFARFADFDRLQFHL